MTYGELRDQFRLILNRRDITPSQVDMYLQAAIQRTQRLLRVPASEVRAVYNVGSDFTRMPIPGNYLKMVSLTLGEDHELTAVDLTTALQAAKYQGHPKWYCRDNFDFVIGPKPREGDQLFIVYHCDFTALADASDQNWLTQVAPDIIINGALSAACRTYVDPRRDAFEGDFVQAIGDLNMQATDDALSNAAISPMYDFDCW